MKLLLAHLIKVFFFYTILNLSHMTYFEIIFSEAHGYVIVFVTTENNS